MGNWNITINGTGPHHNKDNPGDADRLFQDVVDLLVSKGQSLEYASFTAGSREAQKDFTTRPATSRPNVTD